MSATKMKAETATTDINERMRKQKQQQQQMQYNKIENPFATKATDSNTLALSTLNSGRDGANRRNRNKKIRSASGDDLMERQTPAKQQKRHVNFISPNNNKSKLRMKSAESGDKQLMKKSTEHLNATNAKENAMAAMDIVDDAALPTNHKSKSILKVKHTIVLKRKAGTNKISTKLKKLPQGAQAETEAAELSKLAQQFTRNPQDRTVTTTIDEVTQAQVTSAVPMPHTRSISMDDERPKSNRKYKNRRLIKRRYNSATKDLTTAADAVEYGSVKVTDKIAISINKTYSNINLINESLKDFNVPTTSRNITVAMSKEEDQHANNQAKEKENNEKKGEQQQQQLEVPNSKALNRNSNIGNVRRVSNISGTLPATIENIASLVNAQIVSPVFDSNATTTAVYSALRNKNNTSSQNEGVNALPIRFLIRFITTVA